MTLRPQLERYIRALPERASADTRQDLRTFLVWLLQRSGFAIRLAPIHQASPSSRARIGLQTGFDIAASRSSQRQCSEDDRAAEDQSTLEEVVRVIYDRGEAMLVARTAGFPDSRLPDFKTSELFWEEVFRKARDGVLVGGIQPILQAAAERYPDNSVFSRLHSDGEVVEDIFLFVLSHGDVGSSEWRDGIRNDLLELQDTEPSTHDRWLPAGVEQGQVTIVVVHNGDLDREALAHRHTTHHKRLLDIGFAFEWWDLSRLVEQALQVLGGTPRDQIFPPSIRPFYGSILDSLDTAGRITMESIERLLDARLPASDTTSTSDLRRALTELSLFASMLANSEKATTTGLLDLIDGLLRIIVRCTATLIDRDELESRAALADLITTFVDTGERLLASIEDLAEQPDGLALMGQGELIDWPLRTTRFVRDLALTARAAAELSLHHGPANDAHTQRLTGVARRCVECSVALAKSNAGGLCMPMTDDQLIELVIIWRTWIDHGYYEVTCQIATETLTRLTLRRHAALPGPALYLHAGTPMRDLDARILAEAWVDEPPPEFEDGASTLLPVLLFVASRLGPPIGPDVLATFGAIQLGERKLPAISAQSCILPNDAPQRWYGVSLSHRGTCQLHSLADLDPLLEQLLTSQPQLPRSPASTMGFECIDAMAWVLWRTRPPLRWLLDELPNRASLPPDEPTKNEPD